MDDPQVTVLVIVDNPKGVKFGSAVAGPGVKQILSDTLPYMNVSPNSDNERESNDKKVEVPDVVGQSVSDAIGILGGKSLSYDTDKKEAKKNDFIVTKQYPAAGTKVKKGSRIYLYN